MVKAQEWLDRNYPKENRSEVNKIYLTEPNLEGELDLKDFTYVYGIKIYISPNVDETKITFKNLSEWSKIIPIIAQRYLDYHYPNKETRKKTIELDINNKELVGELDLSDFVNLKELSYTNNKLNSMRVNDHSKLEKLICCGNQLINLDTSSCSNLTKINCSGNLLINLSLPTNINNLKVLDLANNNFPLQNLSFLEYTVNLEYLYLGNDKEEKINQGIYNRFTGSLDYLSGMEQLEYLDVSNTDINEVDIEKLPKSLEKIKYSTNLRPSCKLTAIVSQLKEYEWKESIHPNFILEDRRGWEKIGFDKEETREWIKVGVDPWDYRLVGYLREVKKVTPKWVLDNKSSKEYGELKERCNTYAWCQKCQQPNTGENWCQTCAEKEWQQDIKKLTGQELIERFIQKQQLRKLGEIKLVKKAIDEIRAKKVLEWIPYEQFTDVEYLAEGGFSKVYRTKWQGKKSRVSNNNSNEKKHEVLDYTVVVLKSLTDSRNITLEFLTEIVNTKLVDSDGNIVYCYGISQDPETKNYVIVIDYKRDGDLRKFLKENYDRLSFKEKLGKLQDISKGLFFIHLHGLFHRDLHTGNILSDFGYCYITDLGLSKPASSRLEGNKIYGVLPYIAPEVLRGKPYNQASDIYSFGIVMYEVLTNLYPYYEFAHDWDLATKIMKGLRPNLNELVAPQLLKELLEKCWDAEPLKRPTADELLCNLTEWWSEIYVKKDDKFYQQYKKMEEEYNQTSQDTKRVKLKLHPQAIYTSRLLDFNNLPEPENNKEFSDQNWNYEQNKNNIPETMGIDFIDAFEKVSEKDSEMQDENNESGRLIKKIERISLGNKRKLSLNSQNKTSQEKIKFSRIDEMQEPQNELIELDNNTNWTNIYPNFTEELIQQWRSLNFTYQQTQDWINIGLKPSDFCFVVWLRDIKRVNAEWVLNHGNLETLNQEFFTWWQEQQLQTQIEQPPK